MLYFRFSSGLGWHCNWYKVVLVSSGSSVSGIIFQVFGYSGNTLGAWRSWFSDNVSLQHCSLNHNNTLLKVTEKCVLLLELACLSIKKNSVHTCTEESIPAKKSIGPRRFAVL